MIIMITTDTDVHTTAITTLSSSCDDDDNPDTVQDSREIKAQVKCGNSMYTVEPVNVDTCTRSHGNHLEYT